MASQDKANDGIEERETFLQHSQPAKSGFSSFLYDKDAGTCLGRTPRSWVEITVFYIIFYACLAGFWIACLAVFVQTLDDKVPRYYGKGTIIGVNPGMGYQPWIKDDPDSTLIRFNVKDPKSYKKYIDSLEDFLSRYENTNDTRICDGKQSNTDETEESCRFDLDIFNKKGCSKGQNFGFDKGTPCIVVTLNRLIGWEPTSYPDDSAPESIKGRYKPGDIGINCDGEYEPDAEHIGTIDYIPPNGIPGKYYPYKVMKNYHQPIAMVKFTSLPKNKVVLVECKAYAYNILHDSTDRLGLVHFELLVEDKVPPKDEEDEDRR